ncbi:acetyltransferase [Halomonas cupida]|uniref:Putative acetyltransferase n=1 Tax=Halomonas cupida TaxID=44933 RepID=A0A1M7EUQ1_9GAMM|nr:acetyltransferase [Halomonas cupida]SHL95504.1 putative acetyltransferase [Halomonas cupida]
MNIARPDKADHLKLLEVWEASVRATHDFLAEEDLLALKPLILEQYLDAVELTCARDTHGEIVGFSGALDGNLEMLFVAPQARGTGIGSRLVRHAIDHQGIARVDVNEQNEQALAFYRHIGFQITGRSPLDGQGKPYPLLHMALTNM